jgi:hypothetical protein
MEMLAARAFIHCTSKPREALSTAPTMIVRLIWGRRLGVSLPTLQVAVGVRRVADKTSPRFVLRQHIAALWADVAVRFSRRCTNT